MIVETLRRLIEEVRQTGEPIHTSISQLNSAPVHNTESSHDSIYIHKRANSVVVVQSQLTDTFQLIYGEDIPQQTIFEYPTGGVTRLLITTGETYDMTVRFSSGMQYYTRFLNDIQPMLDTLIQYSSELRFQTVRRIYSAAQSFLDMVLKYPNQLFIARDDILLGLHFILLDGPNMNYGAPPKISFSLLLHLRELNSSTILNNTISTWHDEYNESYCDNNNLQHPDLLLKYIGRTHEFPLRAPMFSKFQLPHFLQNLNLLCLRVIQRPDLQFHSSIGKYILYLTTLRSDRSNSYMHDMVTDAVFHFHLMHPENFIVDCRQIAGVIPKHNLNVVPEFRLVNVQSGLFVGVDGGESGEADTDQFFRLTNRSDTDFSQMFEYDKPDGLIFPRVDWMVMQVNKKYDIVTADIRKLKQGFRFERVNIDTYTIRNDQLGNGFVLDVRDSNTLGSIVCMQPRDHTKQSQLWRLEISFNHAELVNQYNFVSDNTRGPYKL
jgi:hypothetical protein